MGRIPTFPGKTPYFYGLSSVCELAPQVNSTINLLGQRQRVGGYYLGQLGEM